MKNKIWIWLVMKRAELKEALGLELTDWEDFLIRIGLY